MTMTMMLARSTLLRRSATSHYLSIRPLTTSSSPYKRALSKTQLEGGANSSKNVDANPTVGAAPTSANAAATATTTSAAAVGASANANKAVGGSGGSGGGALLPLLALGAVGLGGAYYNDLIPREYLPDILVKAKGDDDGKAPTAATKTNDKKVPEELKQVVEEVAAASAAKKTKESSTSSSIDISVVETTTPTTTTTIDEEEISLEHPKGGNRVDIDKINTFYQSVNDDRLNQQTKEEEAAANAAAARATQYNESNETRTTTTTTTEAAMSELQSSSTLQNSKTLETANAAIRSDLDAKYFTDLESLTTSELRIRVIQLATEMADRTKWEALRLKEFLAMKEKEVGEKYLEILQKQRLEYEALLAQKLREQEDSIARQANAALAAKEENIQSLIKATNEAREKEMQDVLATETKRISNEMEWEYQQKLQNELGQMKQVYAAELEQHLTTMSNLQSKLSTLEHRLEVSLNYESGSKKAHRVSAAALALANKLEGSGGAAVELAALRGAVAGEEGVIASAVSLVPKSAETNGVPTLADLQAKFDESYKIGRQVRTNSRTYTHNNIWVLCCLCDGMSDDSLPYMHSFLMEQ